MKFIRANYFWGSNQSNRVAYERPINMSYDHSKFFQVFLTPKLSVVYFFKYFFKVNFLKYFSPQNYQLFSTRYILLIFKITF